MEDKKTKRERGRNFTEKEKEAVVEIIERYVDASGINLFQCFVTS